MRCALARIGRSDVGRWALDVLLMNFANPAALLIVGHGSTVNPDSSTPTWAHAEEIRSRKIFSGVGCAFWKEEPSLRDARFLFDPDTISEVYVVPNFISEGYFTQTVIPRELELAGAGHTAGERAGVEILRTGRQPSGDDRDSSGNARAKWLPAFLRRKPASSLSRTAPI